MGDTKLKPSIAPMPPKARWKFKCVMVGLYMEAVCAECGKTTEITHGEFLIPHCATWPTSDLAETEGKELEDYLYKETGLHIVAFVETIKLEG